MLRTRLVQHTARIPWRRFYATPSASNTPVFQVFNREAKRMQKDRAAKDVESSRTVDYLKDEVAARVADRLQDIKRDFDTVVDLGSGCGHIVKHVNKDMLKKLVMCDTSAYALLRDKDIAYPVEVERRVVDEEHLPFAEDSIDAVVSSMSMHWINDLPGALIQVRKALKPDGVFVGAILGGDTLFELRTALQLAESERESGVSPHVSPMTGKKNLDSSDIARLLSRAGLVLTTVDVDEIQVNYPSMFELMEDLKAMGENNAVLTRRHMLSRDTLLAAAAIYKELHGNPDGSVPATFQIIYMIGWKPSPSTPLPKKRGSATASLKDVLEN
ncbi:S-adenosyl-L-methionine-dependent methyltransferase [Dichotomocladium elegans]|nr:S-adenosyl-L-methionine-dependent methyltransferase [Dichotomocladium elegans]